MNTTGETSIQDVVERILEFDGNGDDDDDGDDGPVYHQQKGSSISNSRRRITPTLLKSNKTCYGGPLSLLALQKLSLLCTASPSPLEGWKDVDVESLMTLLEYLRDHVESAASIDMFREAKEESNGDSKRDTLFCTSVLNSGLEAASVLVSIIAAPNLDAKLVSDELIMAFVTLLRLHMAKHILPALSSMELILNTTNKQELDKMADKVSTSPRKRPISKVSKKTASSSHVLTSEVAKNILSSLDLFIALMEKVNHLCKRINVEDQHIFMIIQCCLSSFTLDPFSSSCISANQALLCIRSLQNSSTTLLTTIFQLHNRHREGIIQDLFPLILKLPTSKRSLRLCQITSNYGQSILSSSYKTVSAGSNTPVETCSQEDILIQFITFLTLRLIQSCILMPNGASYTFDDEQEKNKSPSQFSMSTQLGSNNHGLGDCKKSTDLLVSELILRCNRKTDEAVEYRTFLSKFIEDLLLLIPSIEFPAAETILYTLCHQLLGITVQSSSTVSKGSHNKSSSLAEGGFLLYVFDILGCVCADLAYKRLCLRKHPIQLPKSAAEITIGMEPIESELCKGSSVLKDFSLTGENCQCYCERKFVDTFMLDCDRCHKWFHGSCARVPRDKPLKTWFCDDCVLHGRLLQQAKSLFNFSNKMNDIQFSTRDHIQIMRLTLLKDITASCSSDSKTPDDFSKVSSISMQTNFQQARWFLLATWIEENELRSKTTSEKSDDIFDLTIITRRFISNWYVQFSDQGFANRTDSLPFEMRGRLLLGLFCRSSSLASFSSQLLGLLIAMMGDPSPTLRKGGVKSLTQVVNVDSSLMNQREVREAVAKLFSDNSISVREAAITLAGSYITRVPHLCNVFHNVLLDRLKSDVGVSVRKRVVKILKDVILLCDYGYLGRSAACAALIERMIDAKEDDGVRDLIHHTFQTLWFNPQTSCPTQTKTIAQQMVNVMKISEQSKHLVFLIKEFQGTKNEDKIMTVSTSTTEKSITIDTHLSSLASELIDILLTAVEQPKHSNMDSSSGEDLVAIIRTVNVFAEGAPFTLIKHIETLLPFLKGVNGLSEEYESVVVTHICRIYTNLIQAISCIETAALVYGSLVEDLCLIVDRFGSITMGASIELMVRLSERWNTPCDENKHDKELFKIAAKFYSYLLRIQEKTQRFPASTDTAQASESSTNISLAFESLFTSKILSNIHRSLAGLGFICRHYKSAILSTTTYELSAGVVLISDLRWENLLTASYAIFEYFVRFADIKTRCHALRAITAVFISEPRLLLYAEQRGLFTQVMSTSCETKLLTEALRCWEDMLVSEEARHENGDAKREMDQRNLSLSDKISGDQDGDASLIGSCCTQHSHDLFELSIHVISGVRYQSLSLIDVLLRQGLMNPMEAVPYLFSLQGDFDARIQEYSLKLLLREGDRRPDMLKQRLFHGLISTFFLQRKLYHESKPNALLGIPNKQKKFCICTEIFKRFISSSRSQSNKLLSSLIEPFKCSSQLSAPLRSLVPEVIFKESPERLLLLSYLSEIIAHFPYNNLGDILFVINLALSLVTLDGFVLAHAFDEIFHLVGLQSDFKDGKEKSKMEKKMYTLLMKNTINVNEFSQLCRSAASTILLLRVKFFLCNVYSVSENRLREFQDGGKETAGDKVISRPDDMALFRSDIPELCKGDGVTVNVDALVLIYMEFKELFRHHF